MSLFRLALLCAVLFACATEPSASAQQCDNRAGDMQRQQKTLYEYALVAERAYGEIHAGHCLVERTQERIEAPGYNSATLLQNEDIDTWQDQFSERWRADSPRPHQLGRYPGNDGRTYLTCSYDNFEPQFAITWARTAFSALGPDGINLPVTALIPIIVPVVGVGLLPPDEELGVIRLRRDPAPEIEQEELVAIQGTDITRFPQIMASLNDLMASSCVLKWRLLWLL